MQSSGNLSSNDYQKYWNDALTVVNNTTLYRGYSGYFQKQAAASIDSAQQVTDVLMDTQASRAKAYFFPRAHSGPEDGPDDVIVNILKTVDNAVVRQTLPCRGNDYKEDGTGYGTKDGGTVIRIAMGDITRTKVVEELIRLDKAGCHVDIVHGPTSPEAEALFNGYTAYGGVTRRKLYSELEAPGTTIHTKYLLIEGTYNGKTNQKIVFTGSHTYTHCALIGNDEALLKWDDSVTTDPLSKTVVYDDYRRNFWTQRAAADAQNTLR